MRVVLVYPEIPPNTGNVARLCVGTATSLHLVRPLGFEITDRHLKRAGLDYWPFLDLTVHDSVEGLLERMGDDPFHLVTTHARKSYTTASYTERDWLIFGNETQGLPRFLSARFPERGIRIPMWGPVRCLNLGNAVTAVLFEALRQTRPAAFSVHGAAVSGPDEPAASRPAG